MTKLSSYGKVCPMDTDPNISRRRALAIIGGATGGLLLAACGGKSSTEKGPTTTTRLVGQTPPATSPEAEAPMTELNLEKYAETFRGYAQEVEKRYGIDQNVVLAQSFVESTGGTSELAVQANAFFGIKAKEDWSGKVYPQWTPEEITAEQFDNGFYEEQKLIEHLDNGNVLVSTPQPFRQYDTVLDSFLDYGDRITNSGYYDEGVAVRDNPIAYIDAIAPIYGTDSDYAAKVTARYQDIIALR